MLNVLKKITNIAMILIVALLGFFVVVIPLVGTTAVAVDYVINGPTELTEEEEEYYAEMR